MNEPIALPMDVRLMNATAGALVTALVLAALLAGLWWALRQPAFAIRQIEVSGDTTHTSAAALGADVLPRLSGNFFTLDLAAAQAAFQQVPWVRRAVVRREFPGRLEVRLQEHVAVAGWGADGTHLVNALGEVFDAGGGALPEEADLPQLVGPEGQAPQVLAMYKLLDPLLAPLDEHIGQLELQTRGNWRAELSGGATIELGHGSAADLAARLRQFVDTVKDVAARHQRPVDAIEAADLRHVGGYALRLRGVTTVRLESPDPRAPQR